MGVNWWNVCKENNYNSSKHLSCLVFQSCLTLCDPMDMCMPGFPVLHYLPEFAQTHVHWFGDTIQPSHHLSPPSPPALNLSQHQGLFQWVRSTQVALSKCKPLSYSFKRLLVTRVSLKTTTLMLLMTTALVYSLTYICHLQLMILLLITDMITYSFFHSFTQ